MSSWGCSSHVLHQCGGYGHVPARVAGKAKRENCAEDSGACCAAESHPDGALACGSALSGRKWAWKYVATGMHVNRFVDRLACCNTLQNDSSISVEGCRQIFGHSALRGRHGKLVGSRAGTAYNERRDLAPQLVAAEKTPGGQHAFTKLRTHATAERFILSARCGRYVRLNEPELQRAHPGAGDPAVHGNWNRPQSGTACAAHAS